MRGVRVLFFAGKKQIEIWKEERGVV